MTMHRGLPGTVVGACKQALRDMHLGWVLVVGTIFVVVSVPMASSWLGAVSVTPSLGDWEAQQAANKAVIDGLEAGATRASVTARLGEPDFADRHGNVAVLSYRTHVDRMDNRTTREETTPLVFVDGRLVSWHAPREPLLDRVAAGDDWTERQRANRRRIEALGADATLESVHAALGVPDFIDAFANGVQVHHYRTRSLNQDGYTTRDETTPLVFIDERLVSTGV